MLSDPCGTLPHVVVPVLVCADCQKYAACCGVLWCAVCVVQAQSEVKKLETRLNTNLLKQLQELKSTASAPDLPTDR
jgi:hypothetical protein